jgi:hypothetical protein
MDATTMSQVGMGGGVVGILAIAYQVFRIINHRNIRSHCCGKEVEVGIDVDTPPIRTIPTETKPSSS